MLGIKEWLKQNKIKSNFITDKIFLIDGIEEKFYFLDREDNNMSLFDNHMNFFLYFDERYDIIHNEAKYFVFEFGGNFYYSETEPLPKFDLKLLRNLGEINQVRNIPYCNLAIHGGYELLNGSGSYDDWCKKAKFFGHKSLGIAEYNTLAALLAFQNYAKQNEIKPIFGETIDVKLDSYTFKAKIYVKNKQGWKNLLRIHKNINVDGDGTGIHLMDLQKHTEGIIFVLPQDFDFKNEYTQAILDSFENIYYQIDATIWRSNRRDLEQLNALKEYINKYQDLVQPVLISDSYYIEESDNNVKNILNKIGDVKFQFSSKNQHFKNVDDIFNIFGDMFGKKQDVLEKAIENTIVISDLCDFEIDTSHFRLPKYELTEDEAKIYKDSEELFLALMQEGLDRKIDKSKHKEYQERLDEEIRVIKLGGFIDYFLILWDIMQWCKRENILRGIGRGSAAGSLISYLLDITEADPIEYDLLFERFLNEARLSQGLPDIDCDFPGLKRDDVKRYMEQRYGIDYVASIGTYSTMKLKMAIKDVGRVFDISFKEMNEVTSYLTEEMDGDGKSFLNIFETALKSDNLKKFVLDQVDLVNMLQIVLNQPRSSSIHASAVIVVPKEDENGEPMDIYDWLPVRKVGEMLVSEWEHKYVEQAGFLKEDILGIAQLDKFSNIVRLIKEHTGVDLDIYKDIPLDDENVYEIFHLGLNEDVFQFGSPSQKKYSQEVKPTEIEHLNAMNALYRPGPMDVNAHNDYYQIKNGTQQEQYHWGTEEVLGSTYGLIVYQEQTMKMAQVLADFDLTEADGLRRALTKKGKGSEAQNFKDKFIDRCVAKGCPPAEANYIWEALEAFTKYGFNRSHSLSYAITGYMCQWFKVNYPLEFWITSLQYSKEEAVYAKIAEIEKLSQGVNVSPPDINKAGDGFYADTETKNIYWSLNKIKFVGETAVNIIVEERTKNGQFYDFEEFLSRVPKAKINKRVVYNLIISGAFDEICEIKKGHERDRINLIKQYCKINKKEVEEIYLTPFAKNSNEFWTLRQKESCGLGYINYGKILSSMKDIKWPKETNVEWISEQQFMNCSEKDTGIIGGVVKYINKKVKKDKSNFAELRIECNNEMILCTIWTDEYEKYQDIIDNSLDKIILISGEIYNNKWRGHNTFKAIDTTHIVTIGD